MYGHLHDARVVSMTMICMYCPLLSKYKFLLGRLLFFLHGLRTPVYVHNVCKCTWRSTIFFRAVTLVRNWVALRPTREQSWWYVPNTTLLRVYVQLALSCCSVFLLYTLILTLPPPSSSSSQSARRAIQSAIDQGYSAVEVKTDSTYTIKGTYNITLFIIPWFIVLLHWWTNGSLWGLKGLTIHASHDKICLVIHVYGYWGYTCNKIIFHSVAILVWWCLYSYDRVG